MSDDTSRDVHASGAGATGRRRRSRLRTAAGVAAVAAVAATSSAGATWALGGAGTTAVEPPRVTYACASSVDGTLRTSTQVPGPVPVFNACGTGEREVILGEAQPELPPTPYLIDGLNRNLGLYLGGRLSRVDPRVDVVLGRRVDATLWQIDTTDGQYLGMGDQPHVHYEDNGCTGTVYAEAVDAARVLPIGSSLTMSRRGQGYLRYTENNGAYRVAAPPTSVFVRSRLELVPSVNGWDPPTRRCVPAERSLVGIALTDLGPYPRPAVPPITFITS